MFVRHIMLEMVEMVGLVIGMVRVILGGSSCVVCCLRCPLYVAVEFKLFSMFMMLDDSVSTIAHCY